MVRDDALTRPARLDRERPQRGACATCMYYDPRRAYCNYIHAPVDILFACPQILDMRR